MFIVIKTNKSRDKCYKHLTCEQSLFDFATKKMTFTDKQDLFTTGFEICETASLSHQISREKLPVKKVWSQDGANER